MLVPDQTGSFNQSLILTLILVRAAYIFRPPAHIMDTEQQATELVPLKRPMDLTIGGTQEFRPRKGKYNNTWSELFGGFAN